MPRKLWPMFLGVPRRVKMVVTGSWGSIQWNFRRTQENREDQEMLLL